jgi:branched-chain amino acid transport system substrate-binding protein
MVRVSRRLVCLLLMSVYWSADPGGVSSADSRREFRVGVLVSLTGPWSSLGQNTVAGLQIAADQIEAQGRSQHAGFRIRLLVRDTQLDPTLALEAIEDLGKRGVKVVIGPQSSAELAAIKPYADQNDILVISHGSTVSSLAIPGDNVFRVCPNDVREAAAITALMWRDGVRTIIPLWRNDAGNEGLHDSVQQAFQALGGTVTSGFRYEPATTDFSAAVSVVAAQVANAQLGSSPSRIAVYLAAFDEAVGVFQSAQANSTLSATPWYGSDGVALSQALLEDTTAAAFAVGAGYPNPIFGLDDAFQGSWQPIAEAIQARTSINPDAFALSAYDALFVVHRALQDAGGTKDFAAFKSAFVGEADGYTGITGSTALDAAGDRVSSDFDFWAVRLQNGAYSWVRVERYINGMLF